MNRLFDIFEQTTDAVFGIDQQGHVLFLNSACQALFGWSLADARDRHCSALLCGRDLHDRAFCGDNCPVPKQRSEHNRLNDFDLVVKQSNGNPVMVNINAYYTPASLRQTCRDISVFFSLRRVNCHRLIKRLACTSAQPKVTDFRQGKLTDRETGILRMASEGIKTVDIASKLCISQATVRNHFKNIYKKLDVHSRAQAIALAMNHGII